VLFTELEKCRKSLEGFLETKRIRFPRFFFVSNPVLLVILSQASDPATMQAHYKNVFDAISRVELGAEGAAVVSIIHRSGQAQEGNSGTEEEIRLVKPVATTGNVEEWLAQLEKEMQKTMKTLCERCAAECSSPAVELREFVGKTCAQLALLGLRLSWTQSCQLALDLGSTDKQAMADNNLAQLGILQELLRWGKSKVPSPLERRKLESLVTMQLQHRSVFLELSRLFKERKGLDATDFEWQKQTRVYWRPKSDDRHGSGACIVAVCDVVVPYSYEYLGCKERLVVTTLTDRVYIALTQALSMQLGGAASGPSGMGKTETVKDVGRTLGVFVVVTNCSEQHHYSDIAKIFKGLCQGGVWGCFDDFDRISLPVLSVVAQQMLTITTARRSNTGAFLFAGDSLPMTLNPAMGIFATMTPGNAGRKELPENLKILFREVTMIAPDVEAIIKVKLCSLGYETFAALARKFAALYRLCGQQLSKQRHYDFGLRNVSSVLQTLGAAKRESPHGTDEASLLMRTLRDTNLPKLVVQDVPLFLALLADVFPTVQLSIVRTDTDVRAALESAASARKDRVLSPLWLAKASQLHATTLVRHGIIIAGPSGCGKTSIADLVSEAHTSLRKVPHRRARLNPKSIRTQEMFGETEALSGEWVAGVFASMWIKYNDQSRKDKTWITCDGPVDAGWIENLNSVLDESRILTIANGRFLLSFFLN
jgi:dynein heavy chain